MINEPGYRLNVGLIIVNNAGKLLICKRKGQDAWQFPQGGIDFGEKPLETAYRELHEEVGIDRSSVKLLSENINWEKYDIPLDRRRTHFLSKRFKGQKQKWFLFKLIDNVDISFKNDPAEEFDDYRWASYWEPLELIISFKKTVYHNVLKFFEPIYKETFNNGN